MQTLWEAQIFAPEEGSRRQQIADYYREAILCGEIPPGSRLPPNGELARSLGVGVGSVQWAMNSLVAQGLVTRRSGVGTIVNQHKTELETIGLFFYSSGFYGANAFNRHLIEEIEKECAARGLELKIYIENLRDPSVEHICEGYRRKAFQAAIILGMHSCIEEQVARLPCPWSAISGSKKAKNHFETIAGEAVCRFGQGRVVYLDGGRTKGRAARYSLLRSALRVGGLDFVPERDAYYSKEVVPPGGVDTHHRIGYELMFRLWNDPGERPGSLIAYPDDLVPGILLALPALGISVPRDLKLFLHANAEAPILCPVDCVFIENRIADFAREVIDDCQAQCAGTAAPKFELQYRIREHHFQHPQQGEKQ